MDWKKFLIKLKNPISNSHKIFNIFYEYNLKKLFLSNPIPLQLLHSPNDQSILFDELFDIIDREYNIYKVCESLYLEFDYNYFPSKLDNFTNLKLFYFKGKNYNKFSLGLLPITVEHVIIKDLNLDNKTFENSSKLSNLKILELNLHQIIHHKSILTNKENVLEVKNRNCIPLDGLDKLNKIILHFEYYFIDGEKVFCKWIKFIENSSLFVNMVHRFDEIKLGIPIGKPYAQYVEIIVNPIISTNNQLTSS